MQLVETLYKSYPQLFIYQHIRSVILSDDYKRMSQQFPNLDSSIFKNFTKESLQEIKNNLYTSKYPILLITHYFGKQIAQDEDLIYDFSKPLREVNKMTLSENEKEILRRFYKPLQIEPAIRNITDSLYIL